MNLNLKNRQHLLALLAVAVIALFLGDKLVFTPLVKSWQARTKRLEQLQKDVRNGEALLERAASLEARWAQMRTNTLAADASAAESQIQRALERWSRASGVNASSFRSQWKRPSENHAVLECRLDAAGPLEALARFLYEIEADPLGVKVDRVDLSTRDNEGRQLNLALTLSGLQLLKNGK